MIVKLCDILKFLDDNKFNYHLKEHGCNEVIGFCSLEKIRNDCILWVKNHDEITVDGNNYIVVSKCEIDVNCNNYTLILTEEPKRVFFSILNKFFSSERKKVGENNYIGKDVLIGENTIIENNVSIHDHVVIGKNCIIHSGAVIGADGFGYYINEDGNPEKVEHFGGVTIGDNVEIGANACIDRGTIDNTEIGDNVKIDNLVHIAHNVKVGAGSMIVAGAIVCGSVCLGEQTYIAPGGIIKNQLKLEENVFVGMGAVVTESVKSDKVVYGVPARVVRNVEKKDK